MLESVNYHLSGMNVVIGALHGKFTFLDFLCYRRISHYALRLHPCVQSYGSVKAVALSHILRYIVANRRKQFAELPFFLFAANGSCHSAARLMSLHHQQFHAKMFHSILHAAHHQVSVDIVSGSAYYKHVAHALVEQQFHRLARV